MATTLNRRIAALTLGAGLALTACSQSPEATFEDSATRQSAAQNTGSAGAAASGGGTETGDVGADSAAAAGIDLTQLGDPIATVTVPAVVDGDPEAKMKIALYSLTRQGETLVGNYSFTLESNADPEKTAWLYDHLGSYSWAPHLIDTVNLTRHDVLGSPGSWAKTDSQASKFGPGDTLYAYAAFAAPPADVTSMSASLIEGAPAVEVTLR